MKVCLYGRWEGSQHFFLLSKQITFPFAEKNTSGILRKTFITPVHVSVVTLLIQF
jgi:hypothetical protein